MTGTSKTKLNKEQVSEMTVVFCRQLQDQIPSMIDRLLLMRKVLSVVEDEIDGIESDIEAGAPLETP